LSFLRNRYSAKNINTIVNNELVITLSKVLKNS